MSATPTPASRRLLQALRSPIQQFIEGEQASGLLLIAVTAAALLMANLGWGPALHHLWETPVELRLGSIAIAESLHFWINDVLMGVFFLQVGLEIKREILAGELSSRRKAALPLMAALGGMVVPALIYLAFNLVPGGAPRGWAIPSATDIAFSLGILALLGRRVPDGLKVFLAALAIADDLGAIVIIGVFYTESLQMSYLLAAAAITTGMVVLSLLHHSRLASYLLPGLVLGYCLWRAGVHPTLAGVITAFCIPNSFRFTRARMAEHCEQRIHLLAEGLRAQSLSRRAFTEEIENMFAQMATPAQKLEFNLQWLVPYLIMPLFAFANTGLVLSASSFAQISSPPALGILLGLSLGKPLGIYLMSRLAVRLGWGELPQGVDWRRLLGAGMLAGIGFTMSIFVAGLSFAEAEELEYAKMAILLGSLLSGTLGYLYLARLSRSRA